MALVVKDRVKETTTTTGTGTITLGGASAGFQTFAVIGNGNTTYYTIVDPATGDWEVGIGTYTASGTTLSRTTVLESSNAGSLVNFAAGSKDVFCTYPAERSVYLDTAGSAVTTLDVGTLGVSTANITTANITAGTVSTTPTSGTDIANKTYVDSIAVQSVHYHEAVKYEVPNTTGNLNATYNNGSSGVGATLTNAGTLVAFTPDGVVASVNDRILIYNQTNAYENGVYTVTTVGSGSVAWVLTRATDADTYDPISPTGLGGGDAFFVTSGNTGAGETYVCDNVGTITFGTTAITFAQISSAQVYSAGTGLTLTNTTFSITNTGVSATTYGSASAVPVFAVNAQGQLTSVTNTNIAISSSAVSGLAPSATTDTTNASNITSGTLPSARLNGSYTGITGVGTLAAGTWNGSTIGAPYGGTGQSSYAVGDLLYADTSSSLNKLADVAYGNVLLSGGVGTAPSYGKVSLTSHITGTLAVANGGTGATDASGARSNLGLVIGTDVPSPTGTGASGTWNINISGNAATATYATTAGSSSTPNSVTFNNGGTGAASGTGFNGSSAVTISYNTIGAPSASGSGASGTWAIDISGNAATAGTASNVSASADQAIVNQNNGNAVQWYGRILSKNSTSDKAAFLGTYNNIAGVFAHNNALNAWADLYVNTVDGSGGGTVRLPTTTYIGGTQAVYNSGTWNINVTGSAGSAGSASSVPWTGVSSGTRTNYDLGFQPSGSGYAGFYFSKSTSSPAASDAGYFLIKGAADSFPPYTQEGITLVADANSLNLFARGSSLISGGNAWVRMGTGSTESFRLVSDYSYSLYSSRAPIFYDSDNTGYYLDPSSVSNLYEVYANNWFRTYGQTGLYSSSYGQHFYPINNGRYWSITGNGSTDYGGLLFKTTYESTIKGYVYWDSSGFGLLHNNGGWFIRGWDTGSELYGSTRAPIFYDSSDTTYYTDPASWSVMSGLILGNNTSTAYYNANTNGLCFGTNSPGDYRIYTELENYGGTYTKLTFAWHTGMRFYTYPNYGGVRFFNYTPVSGPPSLSFSVNEGDGNVRVYNNLYAPILYDLNNTGYYCDPSSVSYLYGLTLAGGSYFRPQSWIQFDGSYGLYWPNNYGAHLHANDLSTYTQLALRGNKNGYGGFYDQYSAVNGFMYDSGGNGGVYREANGRWYFYYNLGNDCMGIGTSATSSTYSLYLTKGVYAPSRIDATIFYDSNDTGYYLDLNSTSNSALRIRGGALHGPNPTWGAYLYVGTDGGYIGSASTVAVTNGNLHLDAQSGYNIYLAWYNSSDVLIGGGVQATIYYDRNNTGYYADLNGTTYCYYLQSATSVRSDSDRRVKDNIEPIKNALAKVKQMAGYTYTRTDLADKAKRYMGMIAQEVLPIVPELVGGSEESHYSIAYGETTALLVEAIKELSARLDKLEASTT